MLLTGHSFVKFGVLLTTFTRQPAVSNVIEHVITKPRETMLEVRYFLGFHDLPESWCSQSHIGGVLEKVKYHLLVTLSSLIALFLKNKSFGNN